MRQGLDLLLRAAEVHGRISEPDHEVGDLQLVAYACWKRLTPEARDGVMKECADVLRWLEEEDAPRLP